MPVAADLIAYGSANRPEDDTSTVGGAIDATARPLDSQFSAAATPAMVSDNAGDSANVTITGRLASGAIDTEVQALNGTTEVVFSKTFERILKISMASAASGVVTVLQGSGGTLRHTFAVGETDAFIMFIGAASDPATGKTRYEKYFWKNTNGTEALLSAQIQLSADPASNYEVGIATTVDDSGTATNRETAPAGVSFVDDGVDQSVPGTDLAAGSAVGHWVKQTLAAGEAAAKDTFTTQISGTSAA